jgi:predicted ATP-dependent endonuclease of OLD family
MKLIHRVEIRSFRSLRHESLDETEHLNVIFGRNDSGKSNVLRALNLFFNSETSPETVFDFDRDFSNIHKREVELNKGGKKFIQIYLDINPPKSYRNSLGKRIRIWKRWTSTSDGYASPSIHIAGKKDGRKEAQLTKLMNRLDFHYIPAIKSRSIFEKLLAELYRVLSSNEQFSKSLDGFTNEISFRTEILTQSLNNNLNVRSSIAPPTNLENLFRSLDFNTGDDDSPLSLILQRGDGIQVRHIPEILNFIANSKSSKDYHIWGFEEPENSLELAAAVDESDLFKTLSLESNKQIFVTSHSPAFFNLKGAGIKRYFIDRSVNDFGIGSKIKDISEDSEEAMILMDEIPYLSTLSSSLAALEQERKDLEQSNDELLGKIENLSRPALFVEGSTDKMILECAWKIFFPEKDRTFDIIPAGGTGGLKALKQKNLINQLLPERAAIFAIADNDAEGRDVIKGQNLHTGGLWRQHANWVWWCFLKPTKEYLDWASKYSLPENNWSFIIEFCFSKELRHEAMVEGYYEHDNSIIHDIVKNWTIGGEWKQNEELYINACINNSDDLYYFRPPKANPYKIEFSKWVTRPERATKENFAAFKSILVGLDNHIESLTS